MIYREQSDEINNGTWPSTDTTSMLNLNNCFDIANYVVGIYEPACKPHQAT